MSSQEPAHVALIVQHEEPTPPGRLATWLERLGWGVEVLRIDLEETIPDPALYGFIASLGSEFPAYDDSVTFNARERRLLERALDVDVPVLGICFGGQLLARVLGGRVFRANRAEIGWLPVRPLGRGEVGAGPWFQWHFDTFSIPERSELLADSDVGPQAFRARRSVGLQFHPEVTPEIMEAWVAAYRHELDAEGVDPDELLKETWRRRDEASMNAEALFTWFLEDCVLSSDAKASADG